MNAEFINALEQIAKEKRIGKEILIEAIEAALISAYKRHFGMVQNVAVTVDRLTGEVRVLVKKIVVENVENDINEISLEDAHKIDKKFNIDDIVEIDATPKSFGRIAAQTAKQVVLQRIKEAERNIIYNDFINKENEIVTGIVRRAGKRNVMIELDGVEAILPLNEQVSGEKYNFGDRIKVYITEVKNTSKGPLVLVSRTHPGLVKRLFEQEVPEIHDGVVIIKNICREAGYRTKISVYSDDVNVDPVGACVGQKGSRVQIVVEELKGEKIDIIKWSTDIEEYISAALSPAKVLSVRMNQDEKSAKVLVDSQQLSLAIGKEGQNVRLAAKLTGIKIDIRSDEINVE
jgi:N utilization substance protein A